jgi:hypothetical protein
MPEVAKFVVVHAPILCGLAIIENAYDEVAEIEAVLPEGIGNDHERILLQRAKAMMPRLPWDTLDVLVVDEMGKDVSGAGIDPNVTGRLRIAMHAKPTASHITNITVHDLTDESHGNAIGVGNTDFITTRLFDKIDLQSLYINTLTAGVIAINSCKIPMILPTDRAAIMAAVRTCGRADAGQVHLARIENTLRLEYILASVNSLASIRPGTDIEVLGAPMPFCIETDGSLTPFTTILGAQG